MGAAASSEGCGKRRSEKHQGQLLARQLLSGSSGTPLPAGNAASIGAENTPHQPASHRATWAPGEQEGQGTPPACPAGGAAGILNARGWKQHVLVLSVVLRWDRRGGTWHQS